MAPCLTFLPSLGPSNLPFFPWSFKSSFLPLVLQTFLPSLGTFSHPSFPPYKGRKVRLHQSISSTRGATLKGKISNLCETSLRPSQLMRLIVCMSKIVHIRHCNICHLALPFAIFGKSRNGKICMGVLKDQGKEGKLSMVPNRLKIILDIYRVSQKKCD